MLKMKYGMFLLIVSIVIIISGCGVNKVDNDKLSVVATTTMLADLSKVIGADNVSVNGLMGAGIDPHLYQASAGDVTLIQRADVVVYNGLHLEGKMGEIFKSLSVQGGFVICIEDGLDKAMLLEADEGSYAYDPHVWFDVSLWKQAAKAVAKGFSDADFKNKEAYLLNLESYLNELDELENYIRNKASEIPESQRVLITAHDAFNYFGNAYGFEVRGLQGISTDSEAGTADVSELADFIAQRQIKAIFAESSVPPKTIEALQAAVKAKGFNVSVGGELYSDSLGGNALEDDTYILTFKSNINTIAKALK